MCYDNEVSPWVTDIEEIAIKPQRNTEKKKKKKSHSNDSSVQSNNSSDMALRKWVNQGFLHNHFER